MLPFLSKIFEKLMCARKANNILCTNQFEFRKNSNASDAIIEFLDYVYSSLDNKQSPIAVYLNFSKAFDTVNHNITLLIITQIRFKPMLYDTSDAIMQEPTHPA